MISTLGTTLLANKNINNMAKYCNIYLVVGCILFLNVSIGCFGVQHSNYSHSMLVKNEANKDNSLFYNTQNRVRVLLNGIDFKDLKLSSDSCIIEKNNKLFLITPFADVSVLIKCSVNGVVLDSFRRNVEYVPVTSLSVGGFDSHSSQIPLGKILAYSSISREYYSVKSYDYRCITIEGEEISGSMLGNDITDNERIKQKLKVGFLLFLSNVQVEKQKGIYTKFPCESKFILK